MQKLNAAPEPDSALQRIVSSRRGKTGSAALNRLSKPELQQELRSRGLSDSGLKDELKARLLDSLDVDPSATGVPTPACMLHCNACLHARLHTVLLLLTSHCEM